MGMDGAGGARAERIWGCGSSGLGSSGWEELGFGLGLRMGSSGWEELGHEELGLGLGLGTQAGRGWE